MVIPSESNTKPSETKESSKNSPKGVKKRKSKSVKGANRIKFSPPSIQERRATVAKRKIEKVKITQVSATRIDLLVSLVLIQLEGAGVECGRHSRNKVDVLFGLTPERISFRSVCRLSEHTLHETPQGVTPKEVLCVNSIVLLRLGECKSAGFCNC